MKKKERRELSSFFPPQCLFIKKKRIEKNWVYISVYFASNASPPRFVSPKSTPLPPSSTQCFFSLYLLTPYPLPTQTYSGVRGDFSILIFAFTFSEYVIISNAPPPTQPPTLRQGLSSIFPRFFLPSAPPPPISTQQGNIIETV